MHLFFKELGAGEPLVMLHGLFGSGDNWLGVAPRFAKQFRVLLPDLRNHGQSPHHPAMSYPLLAGDLAEWLDSQNIATVSLLGHSLGGKVVMQLALQFPARVKKLVVVDISPRAYPPDHEKIFRALLALDLSQCRSRRQMEDALAPELPDLTLRRFLLKNIGRRPDGSWFWKMGLRELHENYPKLLEAVSGVTPFAKPALFLRGGKSGYLRAEDQALIHRLFPQAKIETVPGAGHWVHSEKPEEFVRLTIDFLTGQPGKSR